MKIRYTHHNKCIKSTPVTMNSFCSFCASTGIKGPHDHFLRAAKTQGAGVVCPKLLASECNWCHRKGHTVKFCGARQEAGWSAAATRNAIKSTTLNSGDWMHTAVPAKRTFTKVIMPTTSVVSMFAALDIEEESSSDEDECMDCETGLGDTRGTSWAAVVRGDATKELDEEDELPPLIFGAKRATASRWADA